jgi:hypothetical protein
MFTGRVLKEVDRFAETVQGSKEFKRGFQILGGVFHEERRPHFMCIEGWRVFQPILAALHSIQGLKGRRSSSSTKLALPQSPGMNHAPTVKARKRASGEKTKISNRSKQPVFDKHWRSIETRANAKPPGS